MMRVENGQVAEAYNSFDFITFFEQTASRPAIPLCTAAVGRSNRLNIGHSTHSLRQSRALALDGSLAAGSQYRPWGPAYAPREAEAQASHP